jgi:hypothetical protein
MGSGGVLKKVTKMFKDARQNFSFIYFFRLCLMSTQKASLNGRQYLSCKEETSIIIIVFRNMT